MGGIYIHIPYCKSHCTYCGFYSELLRAARGSELFVDALKCEIEQWKVVDNVGNLRASRSAPPKRSLGPSPYSPGVVRVFTESPVDFRPEQEGFSPSGDTIPNIINHLPTTLYIGGGTPSVLPLEQLHRIVGAIKSLWGDGQEGIAVEEFTVEVNPDDIVKGGEEFAKGLRELGVNRISMGVQSFDDGVLHTMGRRHTAQEARRAYEILRRAGFENISIDFIFGYTQQWDVEQMRVGLESLVDMPEHISCYQLSIEEGSGLEKMVQRGRYEMPADEECERQYYAICRLLRELGYEHYEISNWCKPGRWSRHNSSYWDHTPYVGFGPGAHSLLVQEDGTMVRRWNNPDVAAYIKAAESGDWDAVRGSETLTAEQVHQERIMLGLRTAHGVDGMVIPEDKWFISDAIILDMLKD